MSAPPTAAPPATAPTGAAWALSDAWVVARRHLVRLARRPDELLGTLLIPVMAAGMFGFVFGDAFGAAMSVPGSEYREFLLPGLLALTMAFGIGSTTIATAADARGGVLDRMRTLPLSPAAVLAGRTLADVITAVVELTVLMALGLLLGWRGQADIGSVLAALGLLLLLRTAFSWVGTLLGLLVSGPESAMKYFALVFPLALVADTTVPTSLMPDWLAGPAGWNPLSATVIAIRELFGHPSGPEASWPAEHALLLAVLWPLGITVVCVAGALGRLRQMSR